MSAATTMALTGVKLRDLAELPDWGDVLMVWQMEDGTLNAERFACIYGRPTCDTAIGWLPLSEAPEAMHRDAKLWLNPMRLIPSRDKVLVFWAQQGGRIEQAVCMTAEQISLAQCMHIGRFIHPVGWLPLMEAEVCE